MCRSERLYHLSSVSTFVKRSEKKYHQLLRIPDMFFFNSFQTAVVEQQFRDLRDAIWEEGMELEAGTGCVDIVGMCAMRW